MSSARWVGTLAMLAGFLMACSRQPAFRGTTLDPPRETQDFALRDQFGAPVRLSDFRGRPVVLTFLYTFCPDVCPLVTANLHRTYDLLDGAAAHVVLLAVTVDPKRDTVQRIHEYSRQTGMLDRWHFLTGDAKALRPIWDYYWVGDVRLERVGSAADNARPSKIEGASEAERSARAGSGRYTVQHTAPVHLIDKQGKIRAVYGSTFRPAELAHDIEVLLKY